MSQIKNLSIQAIVGRMMKVIFEVERCISAEKKSFNEFDIIRLKSYINELKACKAAQVAIKLDVPHYDKELIEVADFPSVGLSKENNSANELMALLKVLHAEMVKSESKDRVFGLESFDATRFDALVSRVESHIKFMEDEEPGDYPEAAQADAEGK